MDPFSGWKATYEDRQDRLRARLQAELDKEAELAGYSKGYRTHLVMPDGERISLVASGGEGVPVYIPSDDVRRTNDAVVTGLFRATMASILED